MASIQYIGVMKQLAGASEAITEARSVSEMLRELKQRHGETAYKTAKSSHIVVNGESISAIKGYRTKLNPNDHVQIIPVCGGG